MFHGSHVQVYHQSPLLRHRGWLLCALCLCILFSAPVLGEAVPVNMIDTAHYALPMTATDTLDNYIMDPQDNNAEFNALWLKQYQPGNKTRVGGAALGKLFRMGFREVYKGFRNKGHISQKLPDENGRGSVASGTKYRVRLSSDTLKFRVEYKF